MKININMNYKIIASEKILDNYIDFLPTLKDSEVYFGLLFARRKYDESLPKSSALLERFIVGDKRDIKESIRRLEVPKGAYQCKGQDVSQQSLALYISPNPRSTTKSIPKIGKKMWDLQNSKNCNIWQEVLSIYQNTKSDTRFVGVDVDFDEIGSRFSSREKLRYSVEHEIKKFVRPTDVWVIETHSGYHFLIDIRTNKIQGNVIYNLHQNFEIDKVGDFPSPVPGCLQGNSIPLLNKINNI